MRITARTVHGLSAVVDLAATGTTLKAETLAARIDVSQGFLENILADLRRAGIVRAKRGGLGGYNLTRPPEAITVADVLRALEGLHVLDVNAVDDHLGHVWHALGHAVIGAAEAITIASLAP